MPRSLSPKLKSSSKARTGPARPGSGLHTLRVTKSTLRDGKPDPWSRRTWRATTCRPLQTSQGKLTLKRRVALSVT